MVLKNSIKKKVIAWFLSSLVIFSGTMLVLYMNVRHIVRIPETIVSKNLEIASEARKMVEALLSMEEYEKKYFLLNKEDYLVLFLASAREYESSLKTVLDLGKDGFHLDGPWKDLYTAYHQFDLPETQSPVSGTGNKDWIPESVINDWIQKVSGGQYDNEQEIAAATRELKSQQQAFARHVVWGIVVSCLVGLVFAVFLSHAVIRPLRELRNGIRAVPTTHTGQPIRVRSTDEFGELATAFNEMTARLMEEEQMRSDFISMLSHEIRTPLTSIRESVNMISEEVMGRINNKQRKFLSIAGAEIDRINDLLKRLMQISRLQSGVVKIKPRPIDTAPFLNGCLEKIRPMAEKKRIVLETDMPGNLPKVMGDPEHLHQVFLNLMGNAVKFSEVESRITLSAAMKGKKRVAFYIKDQGPGIPEEEQSLIFNKYYRTRSVRNHTDGVGLGLAISKYIVEVHRGWLWVKSKVGEGSTFGLILPVAA